MTEAVISTISRVRGWLLVLIGSALSIGMFVLAAFLAWTIAYNDQPGGTHWRGSHEMTMRVFGLFAAIFLFGLVAVSGGIFQLRRGRPSWLVAGIMIALVVVMIFLGQGIVREPG